MGKHGSQAAQGLHWPPRPELRDVALQIGVDEALAPVRARMIGVGQDAVGEATAGPKRAARGATDLEDIERRQLDTGDAAGRGLAGRLQQVDRGRAQEQESPGPQAATAPSVDQPAQGLEQLRQALDLVQDDQPVLVAGEVEGGVGQLVPVRCVLESKMDAGSPVSAVMGGDPAGQRGLADLGRAEQGDGREPAQPGAKELGLASHPGSPQDLVKFSWGLHKARLIRGHGDFLSFSAPLRRAHRGHRRTGRHTRGGHDSLPCAGTVTVRAGETPCMTIWALFAVCGGGSSARADAAGFHVAPQRLPCVSESARSCRPRGSVADMR